MKRYKFSNIKIEIEDKLKSARLIIHLKETKNPYYKTFTFKALNEKFDNRDKLLNYLTEYIQEKLTVIIY